MDTPGQVVHFLGSERTCTSTATFSFERPEGYAFLAGQFLTLTIETPEGAQSHMFSHCDAPADDASSILTRLTGSVYKDALLALKPGDTAQVSGPHGKLTVPEGMKRVALLVGGVGVSPARGIVRDAVQRGLGLEVVMFDGNHDETCMPFREEFDGYGREDPRLRFIHVLEEPSPAWTGERGFITADLVRRYCDPLEGWHWFTAGPPAMVEAMRAVLKELAVPEADTSFELFSGYR
jgi:ferredoxin-NADP reductase